MLYKLQLSELWSMVKMAMHCIPHEKGINETFGKKEATLIP